MTLQVKDASGNPQNLATGAGDGTTTPFQSPVAVATGSQADTAASNDTGSWSLIALFKRLLSKIPLLGQALMAGSVPVVIASDQTPIPVTGSFSVGGTVTANQGAPPWSVTVSSGTVGISGTVGVTGTFWQSTQPVSAASLPLPTGAATESTLSTLNAKVTACNTGAVVLTTSSAVIGHVIVDSGTITANQGGAPWSVTVSGSVAVTGTFWQATQPVSAAALPLPANAAQETGGHLASIDSHLTACNTGAVVLAAGTAVIGHVIVDSGTVTVGNFPGTQTITGSVSVANFPPSQEETLPPNAAEEHGGNLQLLARTLLGSTSIPGGVTTPSQMVVIAGLSNDTVPRYLPLPEGPGGRSLIVEGVSGGVAVPVGGTVSVGNFPGTQTIAGSVAVSNFPATQTVAGSVSVSNFPATQTVAGSVAVSNFPATQAVTGTFWQPTQPISGTVSIAGTVAVAGAFYQQTQPVSLASAPLAPNASQESGGNLELLARTLLGSTSIPGGATAPAQMVVIAGLSNDGVPRFQPIPEGPGGRSVLVEGVAGGVSVPVSSAQLPESLTSRDNLKVALWETGITLPVSYGSGPFEVVPFLGSIPVTQSGVWGVLGIGTFDVSASSLPLPTGAATESTLSSLNAKVTACDTGNVTLASPVTVANFPAAQTVTGSVSVSNFPASQGSTLSPNAAKEAGGNLQLLAQTLLGSTSLPGGVTPPSQMVVIAGLSSDRVPRYLPIPEGPGGRSVLVEGLAGGNPVTVSLAAPVALAAPVSVGNFPGVQQVTLTLPAVPLPTSLKGPLPSGGNFIGVVGQPGSASVSSPAAVTVGTSAQIVLAANSSRKRAIVQNTGTATIYLNFGAVPPTTSVFHLALAGGASSSDGTGGILLEELWQGAIQAICSVSSGSLAVTEIY